MTEVNSETRTEVRRGRGRRPGAKSSGSKAGPMSVQKKDISDHPVVLVTVSGQDAPGITSELTGVLARSGVTILDIGQAVIHGWLSLSILFEMHPLEEDDKTTIKDILFKATEMGLKLEFQVFNEKQARQRHFSSRPNRYAITLLAENVSARALHEVTAVLARHELNIEIIERLSEGEFSCVEIVVSSSSAPNDHDIKKQLLEIARQQGVDIALQAEGLFRRAKRLVVFDMDSTLIQNEVIDEFARTRGVFDEVAAITHEAMQGGMEFRESLVRRVAKLEGLTDTDVDKAFKNIKLTHGAAELIRVLKRLGYKVALISGGFMSIAERLKRELGIDYAYANQLEFKGGKCTGRVIPPIVDAQRKADLLDVIAQQEGIQLDQVIAVGDGANDLPMLERAGLGIAFNAKPVVREKADMALNQKNLASILYLLGISGRDIKQVL